MGRVSRRKGGGAVMVVGGLVIFVCMGLAALARDDGLRYAYLSLAVLFTIVLLLSVFGVLPH